MQVTVGTKYQIVIPKEIRKKIKDLRPGSKLVVNSIDDKTILIKQVNQNWMAKSRGLMKDAWKNIDPNAELEKMRDEWEYKS